MSQETRPQLLLTCGPGSKRSAPHGDILVVDWDDKEIIDQFRFKHNVYEESHKGLAGATWNGEKLLVATECELLEFSAQPLQLLSSRSFPYLNDVHHVAGRNGKIWVANTGLDCVEIYDSEWKHLETQDLLGSLARRLRYSYTALYFTIKRGYETLRGWRPAYSHMPERPVLRNTRKLLISNAYRRKEHDLRFCLFRPHILHPNHVLVLDQDVWVTVNTTGEVVSLGTGKILANGLGRAHDGIVAGNYHFTTDASINRLVVHEFKPDGPDLGQKVHDKLVTSSRSEGFLRGISVIGDRIFVGLTVRRGPNGYCKTARIWELDRKTLERVDEWSIPDEFGLQVFSVLNASQAYAGTTN